MNGQDATANNTSSLIKIPGYSIKGVLGRGGMATVYLAVQESLGRNVALKVLDPNQAQGERFSERFLREARIVSQLMHPNIVTVFDVGVHEGYHYLSMEYIDGRDLKQACADLSRRELIDIIRDIARALDFAAKKGYVHRDVKPENIMLETDGRVLLMDFGIARSYQNNHGLTRVGSALGTPYYMSPEQNKGLPADHRSDIYSLGVVFFHMLSGYVPYDADSAVAIGIKHITANIPTLSDELQIFQPIINTCMAKEADERYQTAAELIKALDKITDADLAAIEKRSAAFQQQGKNHHAETLISLEVDSKIHADNTNTTARERTSFRGFLILLVLLISGALIYQQQHKILGYAESANIPWLNPIIEKLQSLIQRKKNERAPLITPEISETPVATDTAKKISDTKEQLKLEYIDKIQTAIDSGDAASALRLMAQMQQQFPQSIHNEKFMQTREKLQRAQTITTHITKAKEYFQANAIITNDENNALKELEATLMLEADNPEALDLLQKINRKILNKTKQQAASWRLRKELQQLDELIRRTRIRQPIILSQQKELQQTIRRLAQILNLLQQADADFNNGQLISPENNNAYYRYQKVLAIDPHNRQAKEKLKAIETQLSEQILQAINEDRLTQATLFFEQIQSVYGRPDWLAKIEAVLEQAIEARRPKIESLRLSATPLQSLEPSPQKPLQPGRTLYVGFHFKNMENSPTLLQAILLDGAGQIKIAQKPVILSASEGDHFFQIDLPVEGFSEGSYILEVRLGDKLLLNQSFLVGNIIQP